MAVQTDSTTTHRAGSNLAFQLQGVSRTYGSGRTAIDALRDVDLEVAAGEFVAVMGPSGSAWCEVRRHRGRTALVVLVLALPLAALAAVAIGFSTIPPSDEDVNRSWMGEADGALWLEGQDPAGIVNALPPGTRQTLVRSVHLTVYEAGELLHPDIQEVNLDSPVVDGLYEITSGLAPSAPGEVAVNASLAEDLGLDHGDTWDPPDQEVCGGAIRQELPQTAGSGGRRPHPILTVRRGSGGRCGR